MTTKTFSGRYESLVKIREFVAKAARLAGLDRDEIYAVKLAVDEACTNIIEHAYGGEGRGEIQCSWDVSKDGLRITLRDRGKPFDPSQVQEPNYNVPLEELKPRGAGLFLIRNLMDEVRFNFESEEENVLTMIKRSSS